MLTNAQEKLIKSLHTKKGRQETGLALVEGKKVISTAGKAINFTFTSRDTRLFDKLVTTETPQDIAAVAAIPNWSIDDIASQPNIIILDGIQDPGNVGSILRLCLGFNASLVLVESADVTSPKVIRSSAGAMFQIPWFKISRAKVGELLQDLDRPIYRLEDKRVALAINQSEIDKMPNEIMIVAGSEGEGIKLKTKGTSLKIDHDKKLESLNVTHALAILLHERFK